MTWVALGAFLSSRGLTFKTKLTKLGFEAEIYKGRRVAYATEASQAKHEGNK